MQTITCNIFDIADQMGTQCNYGPIHGKQARESLINKVKEKGENNIWQVSIKNSICSHYTFFGELLSPILDKKCNIYPKNTGFAVDCYNKSDRFQILTGIGFEIGDTGLLSEEHALRQIKKHERYFTLILFDESQEATYKYIGTSDSDLINLLRILDNKGAMSVDDIKSELEWSSTHTLNKLNVLVSRRHILTIGDIEQKVIEPLYLSIAYLLKNGGYHG